MAELGRNTPRADVEEVKEGNTFGLQGIKRNRYSVWGVDVQRHTTHASVLG
jgi:hypothetical protein